MIDASSDSPFYGHMSEINWELENGITKGDDEIYFPDFEGLYILWKLEVLPRYQKQSVPSE